MIKHYFKHLTTSYEAYFLFRKNFITSYATLAISHWILGIGDRHLNNLIVDTTSGRIVGIDFGHAFGFGTRDLPIPELVPFRLTPQITNILEPYGTGGLLERCMHAVLNCYRREIDTLVATMSVFVHEPSIEWIEGGEEWDPDTRIDISRRKLRGANSLLITMQELMQNKYRNRDNFEGKFISGYSKVLMANSRYGTEEELTVPEQIKVLLSHATDPSLMVLIASECW